MSIAVLIVLSSIFVAVCTGTWVVYTRPLGVSHIGGSSELTDKTGAIIQTGSYMGHTALVDLPGLRDFVQYDRLTSITVISDHRKITLKPVTPSELTFKSVNIDSWAWTNETRMTLTGTDGTIILIDNGSVEIAHAPSGTVGFNEQGVKWTVGDASVNTSIVDSACASSGCPLAKCGATLTADFVREVTCNGISLWAWPQGVHLEPDPERQSAQRSRRLQRATQTLAAKSPTAACEATASAGMDACYAEWSPRAVESGSQASFAKCLAATEKKFNACLSAAYR